MNERTAVAAGEAPAALCSYLVNPRMVAKWQQKEKRRKRQDILVHARTIQYFPVSVDAFSNTAQGPSRSLANIVHALLYRATGAEKKSLLLERKHEARAGERAPSFFWMTSSAFSREVAKSNAGSSSSSSSKNNSNICQNNWGEQKLF